MFSDRDDSGAPPVVLVNMTLALRYFPEEDPLGRRIAFGPVGGVTVGVVGDVHQRSLAEPPEAEVYFPYLQLGNLVGRMALVVRTSASPRSLLEPIRALVRSVDPNQPVFAVRTMNEVVDASIGDRRLYLSLLAAFAVVALTLAAAGIYGVLSYAVAQRTQEIGIRLAMGGERRHVLALVLGDGLRLTLVGIAIGIVGAAVLARLLTAMLYGVAAHDPATFAGTAGVVALVAIIACYVPARRAAGIEPMTALRAE